MTRLKAARLLKLICRVRIVIHYVVAAVYTNFTTTVVNVEEFGKGGRYVAGDRGDKLILKFARG